LLEQKSSVYKIKKEIAQKQGYKTSWPESIITLNQPFKAALSYITSLKKQRA
jgi:hypothetical protein